MGSYEIMGYSINKLRQSSLRAKSNVGSLISCLTSGDYRVQDGIRINEEGLKSRVTQKCAQSTQVWWL